MPQDTWENRLRTLEKGSVELLLLLSHFSHVRLCVTPETAAHQAPLSLGFSRQEHWSGLLFLLQCMKVKSESEVAQLCLTLSDPMDCSLPGSSAHGLSRQEYWSGVPLPSPSPSLLKCGAFPIPADTQTELVRLAW